MEILIQIVQIVLVTLPTLWLTAGVRDNLFYPALNETLTSQVMSLERMKQDYPEDFARVSHRAITHRGIQKAVFRLIVLGETLTLLTLWLSIGALISALVGGTDIVVAQGMAMVALLMFTSIWAMFVSVGNHFCYWYCHEGAQNTHYQLMFWGLGTLIFMVITRAA